ncbi:MAG: SUMF1/EgtB/PvdO family nonheme iron enzyme [Candidatus Aminicenantes bacterium]|nr:SUMF1/EgtB/PvdO family nonheme iron enzyme [Candidatus Aminicenantes bacterium]
MDRRLSVGPKHWRIVQAGFAETEGSINIPAGEAELIRVRLDEAGRVPPGMVRVPGGICALSQFQVRSVPPLALGAFWIDRYEVTNREYRVFVEAGGYGDRRYWEQPFVRDGEALGWEEAMRGFVDRSGRPGPATWDQGACPAGTEDYPVTGVSWYEAAAYAAFAGKRLPSAYHWNLAAGLLREVDYMVPSSNLGGQALVPCGASGGPGPFGAYDMAGNAKEWCSNEAGGGRVNLGGAWNEAQYWFFLFDHYPPFMRAGNFGFRCMKDAGEGGAVESAHAPLEIRPEPDYAAMRPCPDPVFEAFRALYAYTRTDLAARVESWREWSPDTVVEKVSFLDAGGGARIVAYLFLPRNASPPSSPSSTSRVLRPCRSTRSSTTRRSRAARWSSSPRAGGPSSFPCSGTRSSGGRSRCRRAAESSCATGWSGTTGSWPGRWITWRPGRISILRGSPTRG